MSAIKKNVLSIIIILGFTGIVFYPQVSDHLTQRQVLTILSIVVFFTLLPIIKIIKVIFITKNNKG